MRILVLIGGAVASVFVLGAVLLTLLVDPNKYTADVSRLVQEKTGRELVFEGQVRLAFFPRLGVQTGGVRLGGAPAFGDAPFASVQAASVSVRLLPLLRGKVEVGRVALDGLSLNLFRDELGKANWADLLDPDEDKPEAEQRKPAKDSGPSSLSTLRLDGLRVKDAALVFEDRLAGKRYAFSGLNLEVKALRSGQPADFEAAFLFESAKPQLAAQVELSGQATLNAGEDRHIFANQQIKCSATGKAIPGGKGEFAISLSELKLDMAKQTAQGAGFSLSAYGAMATGQFQGANIIDAPEWKGRLDFPDFNGRELSAALTGKSQEQLAADASAYQHISGALEFRSGRGYLEIPNFAASLDDARVEGRFRSTGLEQKSYSFNIRVSGLDADRFLPARKAEAEPAAGSSSAGGGSVVGGSVGGAPLGPDGKPEELFPVKLLRETKVDGQIAAERLKIKGLRFGSLKVPVMCQDGVLDVGLVEARLYDGTVKGSLRVDVQGDRPAVTLSFQAERLQQKPLFSDLAGKESQYAGVMSLDTLSPLVCQGNGLHALKRSLSGRLRFAVREGVFPGVNLLSVARDSGKKAQEALGGAGQANAAEKSTRFGSIDGTAVISGGVAAINDLDFKAPFLRADGRGSVDLASKQTDYTLSVRVVPSSEGQGGSAAIPGLVIPLRITGPYDNPSFATDYLRALGKGAVDAVGGVVQGIGEIITGKKQQPHQGGTPEKKPSGGVLDSVKKLF